MIITHGWPGSVFEQIKLIGPLTWGLLMKRLGYPRYVAQGGDWGASVVQAMGRQVPAGLLGIHTNLPAAVTTRVAALAGGPAPAGLSEKERPEAFHNGPRYSGVLAAAGFPECQHDKACQTSDCRAGKVIRCPQIMNRMSEPYVGYA